MHRLVRRVDAVGVELDLARGQHVVVDVVAFGRGLRPSAAAARRRTRGSSPGASPAERPAPRRPTGRGAPRTGSRSRRAGSAPHAERDPRPLQGSEVVLGGTEPDPEAAGELRGGQGLGAEEVEHPDARRVRERPHRGEPRDAMRESTGRRLPRWSRGQPYNISYRVSDLTAMEHVCRSTRVGGSITHPPMGGHRRTIGNVASAYPPR